MDNDDVYDSITSGALRMARRRWYLIVLGAIVGLAAGIAIQALSPAVTGTQTVRFAPIPDEGRTENDSTRSNQTDAAILAKRLDVAVENLELPDGTEVTALGDADTAILRATATGPDTQSVQSALAEATALAGELAVAEAAATYVSDIEVLERSLEAARARSAETEQALTEGRAQQLDPSTLNLLVSEQIESAGRQAELELELATAQARLQLIESTLVDIDDPVISSSGMSPVQPAIFAVLGALVAFGCMVVLQALDGRIRRRLQIERDAPSVAVLGTLARQASPAARAEFAKSAQRHFERRGLTRILLVPLADGPTRQVEELIDLPSVTTTEPALAEGYGSPEVGLLYIAPFGKATLDQLRADASAALAGGVPEVLVVLVDVPAADLAWAGASARL